MNSIQLWRFTDPVLGPRKIPVIGDYTSKCTALENAAVLRVDVTANKVELASNGKNIDLGTQLLYTYEKAV